MSKKVLILIIVLLCNITTAHAQVCTIAKQQKNPPYNGWGYIIEKLRKEGIPEQLLKSTYGDKRMPKFSTVTFKLKPQETHHLYRYVATDLTIKTTQDFLSQYRKTFDQAEREYGVNRQVIAAILFIETRFGKILGKANVLERLSRVASATEPNNICEVYNQLKKQDKKTTYVAVQNRAEYLQRIFLPEVVALFTIADKGNVDILALKGSSAGAFGMPQFLPASYLKHAVSPDKNRIPSLFNERDAILSVASFLSSHGWKAANTKDKRTAVIKKYNNSDAYAAAVIKLANRCGYAY